MDGERAVIRRLLATFFAACIIAPTTAAAIEPTAATAPAADPAPAAEAAVLHPGAIELGVAGSMSAVAGSTRGTALVRLGRFQRLAAGLAAVEGEVAYSHISSLDALGFEASVSYQRRAGATSSYPYAALAAGIREEWIGSFRDYRVPVGVTVGLRTLAGSRAAVRIEYRVRRVLHDPVADYTEQQLGVGLSLLFHNSERR
jgi:hypothetical protein